MKENVRRCRAFECQRQLWNDDTDDQGYCNDCAEWVWAWGPIRGEWLFVREENDDDEVDLSRGPQCDSCGGPYIKEAYLPDCTLEFDEIAIPYVLKQGVNGSEYVECPGCEAKYNVRLKQRHEVTF